MAGVTMRLLLLLPLAACYADSALTKEGDTSGASSDTGGNDGEDSALDTGDTGEVLVPAWYTVSARLTVVGGVASTKAAEVTAVIVAEDQVTAACEVPLDVAGLTVGKSPIPEVAYWWELEITPAKAPCATLPASIEFGLGEMGADVLARLGAEGLDDVAGSLYGAYLREPESEVYIYGWAGTDSDLAGDTAATFPPPDGVYTLAPLYLLRLP